MPSIHVCIGSAEYRKIKRPFPPPAAPAARRAPALPGGADAPCEGGSQQGCACSARRGEVAAVAAGRPGPAGAAPAGR